MKVADLAGHKVMIAVSGGLDSCTITHWLKEKGIEVIAYTADLGQPDEADIEDVRQRMLACGASEMIVGDLKNSVSSADTTHTIIGSIRRRILEYNRHCSTCCCCRYGSSPAGAWNLYSIARCYWTRKRSNALSTGCSKCSLQISTCMLHGATMNFFRFFGGRKEMIDYCDTHNLPITATHDKPYSTDANLLGLTHEAGELEALTTPANRIVPGMGVFPSDAPNEPELFAVEFIEGIPAQINGQRVLRV